MSAAEGSGAPARVAAAMQGDAVVLLGEVHDNATGHALRARWLGDAVAAGWRPALVFEQFEAARQGELAAARSACGRDAGCLIERAGGGGWDWPLYRPLVQLALDNDLPMVGAGIGRSGMGALRQGGYPALFDAATLARYRPDAAPADLVAGQRRAIEQGHCNKLPARAVDAMLPMQFSRDIAMADALLAHGQNGAVLIAGNGHVRQDLGVPRWWRGRAEPRVVGFVEAAGDDALYDVTVTVPAAPREDPCAAFAVPAGKS
nr:ChaN family lipoprotein [Crenobacter caeni]